jgi:putative transcriptional regulator
MWQADAPRPQLRGAMSEDGYLPGQLLVAMPTMGDSRFQRTVIYMCAHSAQGAMGLVINKVLDNITFPDLLEQLGIEESTLEQRIQVHFGGPVEQTRGFVLHSSDYIQDSSLVIDETIALTASLDVLKAIASGQGPRHSILALGYAGWGPGQLDAEIQANGWLHAPAEMRLIFEADLDRKWQAAVASVGVDLSLLSGEFGHA